MLIRLQNLGLWKAELVLWHEMTNGTFAVKLDMENWGENGLREDTAVPPSPREATKPGH